MKARRVAVLLNAAHTGDRAATRVLVQALSQPGVQLATTSALGEARRVLYQWVGDQVEVILFGGGDGTLAMGLSLLAEACRDRRHPAIGVVRLGTGNAFAHARGVAPGVDGARQQVARARDPDHRLERFRPLDAVGVRAPFCGFGIDAMLIDDHAAMNARLAQLANALPLGNRALTALRRRTGGALPYALSIAARSLPQLALRARPRVVITNLGAPAQRLDRDGRSRGAPIARGEVLWQGACTMAAAATIPCFGFGLRMFQYAGRDLARFHLRASDASLLEVARNTRAAFAGTYTSDHVHDFLADRVEIAVSPPAPFEIGGEAMGRLPRIEVALGPVLEVV